MTFLTALTTVEPILPGIIGITFLVLAVLGARELLIEAKEALHKGIKA